MTYLVYMMHCSSRGDSVNATSEAITIAKNTLCHFANVVGINEIPHCGLRYRESSLHATLSIMLTPCKSMEDGLAFQGLAFLSHRCS